ncbi:MAG: hypothetical protein GF400_00835 [Candidatus Eisenbacteria bacterium]|nr:hypothetical protein [Candidatus Eisenbacteria bacterium]
MGLPELTARVRAAVPDGWEIVEAETGETPIGWSGEGSGLLVMAEDTRTRFFHPNGFHYYSFYRVWIMPSDWEGVMRHTPYVSDSVPAYLLGANERYVAFYHTAGGNVWPEGLEELCDALGLDRICYTDLTRRVVDMEIEKKLTRAPSESGFELNPKRIVGLLGSGSHVYMEYVFPEREGIDESKLLATMTDKLAGNVFDRIPQAESLYLRRCTVDTYTDTIVTRG